MNQPSPTPEPGASRVSFWVCGIRSGIFLGYAVASEAYIALGSNLGDRRAMIARAIRRIHEQPAIAVERVSSIIETDPVGPPGQGPYMNAAILVRTDHDPRGLLDSLLAIESELGRDRSADAVRWGARRIDLDVLVYGDQIVDEPGLHVPHPRLHERTFVLIPLAEIAPELVIPPANRTPREMLGALRGA